MNLITLKNETIENICRTKKYLKSNGYLCPSTKKLIPGTYIVSAPLKMTSMRLQLKLHHFTSFDLNDIICCSMTTR